MGHISIDYSQPANVKFSQASIALAQQAYYLLKNHPPLRVLDLGSGSGVVGLEFVVLRGLIDQLHGVEKNSVFYSSWQKNTDKVLRINPQFQACLHRCCWEEFLQVNRLEFDLIVSNPPFYLPGEGKRAVCPDRDQCHFWSVSSLESWVACIHTHLSVQGLACFIIKQGHGKSYDLITNEFKKRKMILKKITQQSFGSIFSVFHALDVKRNKELF